MSGTPRMKALKQEKRQLIAAIKESKKEEDIQRLTEVVAEMKALEKGQKDAAKPYVGTSKDGVVWDKVKDTVEDCMNDCMDKFDDPDEIDNCISNCRGSSSTFTLTKK